MPRLRFFAICGAAVWLGASTALTLAQASPTLPPAPAAKPALPPPPAPKSVASPPAPPARFTPLPLPRWPLRLQSDVVRLSRTFPGEFAFMVKDLNSGERYTYNGATPFYLASVIKVLVLREVYRALDRGELQMTEELEYTSADLRDGSGELKRSTFGSKFTIDQLVTMMIGQSDNVATDMLLGRLKLDSVNAAARELGTFGPLTTMIDVRRKVYSNLHPDARTLTPQQIYDLWRVPLSRRAQALAKLLGGPPLNRNHLEKAYAAYYDALENSAPMEAVTELLESLVRCEGLSPTSCTGVMEKLKRCETGHTRVRAYWPAEAVFAHKTGTQHHRACDVGVLFLEEKRPVVVAACAKDFNRHADADRLFAQLGKAAWEALTQQRLSAARRVEAAGSDDT